MAGLGVGGGCEGWGANSYVNSVFSTEWGGLPGVLGGRGANSYPNSVFSTDPLVDVGRSR